MSQQGNGRANALSLLVGYTTYEKDKFSKSNPIKMFHNCSDLEEEEAGRKKGKSPLPEIHRHGA